MGLRIAVGDGTVWTWTGGSGSTAVHHIAFLDDRALHLRLRILTGRKARKVLGWLNAGAPPEGPSWRSIPLGDIAELRYADSLARLEIVRRSGRSRAIASPADETCREIQEALGEVLAPGVRPVPRDLPGWRSVGLPAILLAALAVAGPVSILSTSGPGGFLADLLGPNGRLATALALAAVIAGLLGWIVHRLRHPVRARAIVVPAGRRPVAAP